MKKFFEFKQLRTKEETFEDAEGIKDFWCKEGTQQELIRVEKLSIDWATKEFADWNSSLEKEEKETLFDYKNLIQEQKKISLEKAKLLESGEFIGDKIQDQASDNIARLDQVLEKSKISRPVYVYCYVKESYFFPEEPDFKFTELSKQFPKEHLFFNYYFVSRFQKEIIGAQKEYLRPNFFRASLAKDTKEATEKFKEKPILLRIKLSQGDNAIYLKEYGGENKFLIGRNNVFKYNKISVQKSYGNKILVVDTEISRSRQKDNDIVSKKESSPISTSNLDFKKFADQTTLLANNHHQPSTSKTLTVDKSTGAIPKTTRKKYYVEKNSSLPEALNSQTPTVSQKFKKTSTSSLEKEKNFEKLRERVSETKSWFSTINKRKIEKPNVVTKRWKALDNNEQHKQ